MARSPKPWFREDRGEYFVTVRGARHRLGPDKAEADRRFHALMAADPTALPPAAVPGMPSVAEVFNCFLDWCEKHRSPRTYAFYRVRVQSFLHATKLGRVLADQVKPYHVQGWVDGKAAWGANQKRGAVITIQRAFNWAVKIGHLSASPVRGVEKPKAARRDRLVSPADYARIRDSYPAGDPFRDLVEFLWEAGVRPEEARRVESRHVDLAAGLIAIPPAEAKGKKRWRLVRLSEAAGAVVRRRMASCNTRVFENADGNPWTVHSVNCRFQRLARRLGAKFSAYDFRHGFCQRLLESGADHLTVAELMGHANGVMVATTYSHMNKADGHLREALKKAGGGPQAT